MDRLLFKSVQTRRKLEMIYLNAGNQTSCRVIRVYGFNADTVTAYCFSREHIRTFKRDRILSIGLFVQKVGI